jgi:hypothetical protein
MRNGRQPKLACVEGGARQGDQRALRWHASLAKAGELLLSPDDRFRAANLMASPVKGLIESSARLRYKGRRPDSFGKLGSQRMTSWYRRRVQAE